MMMPSRYLSLDWGAAAAAVCAEADAAMSVHSIHATAAGILINARTNTSVPPAEVRKIERLRDGRGLRAAEPPCRSAECDGLGEAGLARFLVLAVHVSGRLGQSHHGGV